MRAIGSKGAPIAIAVPRGGELVYPPDGVTRCQGKLAVVFTPAYSFRQSAIGCFCRIRWPQHLAVTVYSLYIDLGVSASHVALYPENSHRATRVPCANLADSPHKKKSHAITHAYRHATLHRGKVAGYSDENFRRQPTASTGMSPEAASSKKPSYCLDDDAARH